MPSFMGLYTSLQIMRAERQRLQAPPSTASPRTCAQPGVEDEGEGEGEQGGKDYCGASDSEEEGSGLDMEG
mgnify:CR=1 FL=1